MVNNRVFWPIEQIAIKDNAAAATNLVAPLNAIEHGSGCLAGVVDQVSGLWEVPRGVQAAGTTTDFNTEEAFQLGQVELYEFSERQPDIEMTLSKVLDGTKPLWLMVTDPAEEGLVAKTTDYRVDVVMTVYADTESRANQTTPLSAQTASGMYINAVTYTFDVDAPATEEITLVGNDKKWASYDPAVSGEVTSVFPPPSGDPEAPAGVPSGVFGHEDIGNLQELAGGEGGFGVLVVGSGIQRREEVDIGRSVLPVDIPGVLEFTASLTGCELLGNPAASGFSVFVGQSNTANIIEHLQTITITADFGRDDIFELGSKRPFVKVVGFPVEVTTTIEVITSQGDLIDATSEIDCGPDNAQQNNTIIVRTCDGLQVDAGDSNRIVSVDLGGGEAGGDNMTVTYTFTTFNTLRVTHDRYDPRHRVIVNRDPASRFNFGPSAP